MENSVAIFGSVYGREHQSERRKALQRLRAACEEGDIACPARYIYGLREELTDAWAEQLREKRREFPRVLGAQNPRKEDVKMVAMAADDAAGIACLSFPGVFDLDAPGGYCRLVCIPRQGRRNRRFLRRTLHGRAPKDPPPRAGGTEDPYVPPQPAGDERVGGGKGKREPGGKHPPEDKPPSRAYLAGKKLSPKEVGESVQHAPRDRSGNIICWGACAWAGCAKIGAACARPRADQRLGQPSLRRPGAAHQEGRLEVRDQS